MKQFPVIRSLFVCQILYLLCFHNWPLTSPSCLFKFSYRKSTPEGASKFYDLIFVDFVNIHFALFLVLLNYKKHQKEVCYEAFFTLFQHYL
nr:MAG TPA: hypothetical protein [Caudoviricetes sp.]